MDLSNPVSLDLTSDGLDADLHADLNSCGSLATTHGLFIDKSSASTFLLCAVSGDRLDFGVLRVHARKKRALALVVVVISSALLLSTSDVLRNDQIGGDGCARTGGWVGEIGAEGDSRGGFIRKSLFVLGHFPVLEIV